MPFTWVKGCSMSWACIKHPRNHWDLRPTIQIHRENLTYLVQRPMWSIYESVLAYMWQCNAQNAKAPLKPVMNAVIMQTVNRSISNFSCFSVKMYVVGVNAKLNGKVRSTQMEGICLIIARKLHEKKVQMQYPTSTAYLAASKPKILIYVSKPNIYIVTIALLYLDVCVYISTIYIFIILLSRNNVFMWLKHSRSPQFQIYSHISDFAHGLLSGSGVEWETLQWAGPCASLQLELVLCSHGAGTFQQSPRHSCSGRSSHLHLALESLSRGRAITTYSAAFGLFLSKELLKDISYYSSVLWPWHTVYSQTVFLVSCCLMHQNFLLMYSVWPISFIAAEIGPYVIRKVLSFPSLNPDNCKLYFSCFGLRGRGGFVNAYLLCVIRWCFCNVLWDLGLGGATQSQ